MLSVNTNVSSLNTQRRFVNISQNLSTSFERLSSGLRINGAKDDAAGLSISTRMTAQVRGTQKAIQNANDNISFVQTTEGALGEVTNILQRMRELTIQASSNILSEGDRESIQGELNQLISEIDRINESSTFNGKQVFSQHKTISTAAESFVKDGFNVTYDTASITTSDGGSYASELQASMLRESVERIERYYGITPKNADLTINFTTGQPYAGQVSSGGGLTMTFDEDDVAAGGVPLAIHEITHAVMVAAGASGSRWWMEGTAQFMEDGDSLLNTQVNASNAADIADQDLENWVGGLDLKDYAASYAAVRYLHDKIKDSGNEGIKTMMELMSDGASFDQALAQASGYASESSFLNDFIANGEAYINTLDLGNSDIGIIGGADADGGDVVTIDDILAGIQQNEERKTGGQKVNMHIGTGSEDIMNMTIGSFNSSALNLKDISIVKFDNTRGFLANIDAALDHVSAMRSELGAVQNRLETTINSLSIAQETTSASRSRILDADFASETAKLGSAQIVQQAAVSILAQSNISPRLALSLL